MCFTSLTTCIYSSMYFTSLCTCAYSLCVSLDCQLVHVVCVFHLNIYGYIVYVLYLNIYGYIVLCVSLECLLVYISYVFYFPVYLYMLSLCFTLQSFIRIYSNIVSASAVFNGFGLDLQTSISVKSTFKYRQEAPY